MAKAITFEILQLVEISVPPTASKAGSWLEIVMTLMKLIII